MLSLSLLNAEQGTLRSPGLDGLWSGDLSCLTIPGRPAAARPPLACLVDDQQEKSGEQQAVGVEKERGEKLTSEQTSFVVVKEN